MGAIPATLWAVGLITLAGGLLRFIGIGSQSFWLDEFLTWDFGNKPLGEVRTWLRVEPHGYPPLYLVCTWVWSHLVGNTEVGLRSLSALFGTATIPLVYAAAVTRVSRRAALLAALFVAVSPFAIWYSQEARSYAMFGALCMLSLLCVLRAIDSPGRWTWGWAVASALALATHYHAVFLVAVEALWLLRVHGLRPLRWPLALVVGVQLLNVLYLVTGDLELRQSQSTWIREIPMGDRLEGIAIQFLTGLQLIDPFGADITTRFWIVVVLAIVGVGVACAIRAEWIAVRPFLLIAGACILLPLAIAVVKPSSDYFLPRYLYAAQAPLLIVVAAGFAARRAGRAGLVAGGVVAGILLSFTMSIALRDELQRPDWRRVGEAVAPPPRRAPSSSIRGSPRFRCGSTSRTWPWSTRAWRHPGSRRASSNARRSR